MHVAAQTSRGYTVGNLLPRMQAVPHVLGNHDANPAFFSVNFSAQQYCFAFRCPTLTAVSSPLFAYVKDFSSLSRHLKFELRLFECFLKRSHLPFSYLCPATWAKSPMPNVADCVSEAFPCFFGCVNP